jgi:imidazolonepropionase
MDANVPVALATDYNPGSAPSGNMSRVVQMGMVKMKMHPLEAIAAATINGAAAMGVSDAAGTIAPGRSANLVLTKPMSGLETLGYSFGEEPVEKVFIDGVQQ